MKKLLFSIAFLALAKSASAQGLSYVQEVALSSGTIWTIAIPSATVSATGATDIATLVPTGKLNGAYAIEIYNLSASTNTINCSYDNRVTASTPVGAKTYGREIVAGVGMVWHVLMGKLAVYCVTANTTGITYATVTQIR